VAHIAVVQCPGRDPRRPPRDLSVLADYLRQKGHRVSVRDLNIDLFSKETESRKIWDPALLHKWQDEDALTEIIDTLKLDMPKLAAELLDTGARWFCFDVDRKNLFFTKRLSRLIKRLDGEARILYGGPSARLAGERSLVTPEEADYFVLFEDPISADELISRFESQKSLEFVRGVLSICGTPPAEHLPRPPVKSLDVYPLPTYRGFNLQDYPGREIEVRLTRGCAYRCAFCGEQPLEGPLVAHSAERTFEEIKQAADELGRDSVIFNDLVINGDPRLLEELCDLVIDSGLKLGWSANCAPTPEMTFELYKKMHSSGCKVLIFGVESLSTRVLKAMNKPYTAPEAMDSMQSAKAADIEVHANLIVGFPGEEDDDLLETARKLQESQRLIDWIDAVHPCYVFPNSALERQADRYGVYLPAGPERFNRWHYENKNNYSYRAKKLKELALFISDLDVKFHLGHVVAPNDPIGQFAARIKERMKARVRARPEVVLVTLPPWGVNNPPVALAYLSNFLKHHGIQSEVIDLNIDFYHAAPEDLKLLWHVENKNYWSNEKTFEVIRYIFAEELEKAAEKILECDAPIIGFSVVDPKERITIDLIRRIRRHNQLARIILGGPACFTPEYRRIFHERAGKLIDGYAMGEGEGVLLEAIYRVREGRPFDGMPGLLTEVGDGGFHFVPRPLIEPLDGVPYPTYEEFDHDRYLGDALILEWSRGCIGNCTFCKGREIAGHYRPRSAEHIYAELEHHIAELDYRSFTVCDPVLIGDPKIIDELCELIIDTGYEIQWNGEALPGDWITKELLGKMARAGCYEIQWGIETGSDNVLKKMNKLRFFKVEDAERVIRWSHDAGIKTCLFVIVGFPGETREDFEKTLEFIRVNQQWIDQVKSINSLHVITGTMIHRNAETFGLKLPEADYHYLWEGPHGNVPEERNRRIRETLKLCQELGIEVLETNLAEGKQYDLASEISKGGLSREEQVEILTRQVNKLESFDPTLDIVRTEREVISVGGVQGIAAGEPGEGAGDADVAGVADVSQAEVADEPLETREAISEEVCEDGASGVERLSDRERVELAGIVTDRVFGGPRILELDLTNNCNLNCVGCWCHSDLLGDRKLSGEEKRLRLPFDLIEKLLREARSMGTETLQLAGAGEPFVHPKMMEILALAKSLGFSVNVITNFTLVDEKRAEKLVELGVDMITVSLWAGSTKTYLKTHPNQRAKTFKRIREMLTYVHELKQKHKTYKPHIKIYNVISTLNSGDIKNMVDFALDTMADYIEFTPIDIVKGYTDSLALTREDRRIILEQLDDLLEHPDFLELDPAKPKRDKAHVDAESKEFSRFVKRKVLVDPNEKWFKYKLSDIEMFDVVCPRKSWKLDIEEDHEKYNALFFCYPADECEKCPYIEKCPIDKETFCVKVEYLSFLGFGAFYRRIQSEEIDRGVYDADVVNKLPCTVGWTYARVLTTGEVIPCCKADKMPLGDLKKDSFRDIWCSGRYQEFRLKARDLDKTDGYFAVIRCLDACDNYGTNLEVYEKLNGLSREGRRELESLDLTPVCESKD